MTAQKIRVVAYYTFKELLKSKILLTVFFVGLCMMFITYVATEFTYGVPERVALDFGIGMLSLTSLSISLFLGVGLLSKEIESRTVYMVISRPTPRYAFIVGKLIGLMGIQLINTLLLGTMTVATTSLLGGDINSVILWSIGFIFLESLMLLLVVVLISLISNNILAAVLSIIILLLGHAVQETQSITFVKSHGFLKSVLEIYHFILPGFYKLNLKEFVIYEVSLPDEYIISTAAYGLLYSAFLLSVIIFIFNRKNID